MAALRKTDLWQPKPRIEHSFYQQLQKLFKILWNAIKDEPDPFQIVHTLRNLGNVYRINDFAESTAAGMVTMLLRDGATNWREAARQSSKGRFIYDALRKELQGPIGGAFYVQIARNAELIRTLPLDIADHVTDYIGRESQKGRRASDIAEDIQQMFPANSRAKAQLIARTEVSKTSTALTQARALSINLPYYEWETSEDQRVRSSHHLMQGVLVRWNDPPAPEQLAGIRSTLGHYHAGNAPNCRCYPAPLTDIDRVAWPHKVYAGGRIVMMTRSRFLSLAA